VKSRPTSLPGVLLLEPEVFGDLRGFFLEAWNERHFRELGIGAHFVQDNHSLSCKGTLRGLHFQCPNPQGRLVWVIEGEVFDVAVDLRRESPTFGKWEGFVLSEENRLRVWVPRGFAHGFYVTSQKAQLLYKTDAFYSPADEKTLAWDDPDLRIQWPMKDACPPVLSPKDSNGLPFRECPFFLGEVPAPPCNRVKKKD
jgi:dTDP-4-dehydrorhamnose 3,5-epimerase